MNKQKNTVSNILATHRKNRDILIREGFVVTNYLNTANTMVLEAYHKDGRKVAIRV